MRAKVSIRQGKVRGRTVWILDRSENGKRKRSFFASKREAEAEAETVNDQRKSIGESWLNLTPQERSEVAAILFEVKERGLTLRSVWEHYKNGSGSGKIKERRTLAQAIVETLETKRAVKRREHYVESLESYLRKFAAGRENLPVDRIGPADIETWFVARKESPTTRASNLGRLSAMFGLCYRRDYIESNPCDKVERVSIPAGRPKIFSLEDSEKLLRTCIKTDKKFLGYLTLGLLAGLRPEEAELITWKDIDFQNSRIAISEQVSKVHRWRYVPLEPAAAAWLKACDKRASLIPNLNTLRRRRRRLCKRAGVVWHQDILRKTSASYLMAKHKDAQKVSEWLGNSPSVLRRNYRDLVPPEDAEKFWGLRP